MNSLNIISKIYYLLRKFFNQKSLKILFKEIYNLFLYYYLYKLQERVVLKKKYIPNVKKYFSKDLKKIDFSLISPRVKIQFTKSELEFLGNHSISCSKIIKKKRFQGYDQKEIFLCTFENIRFFGHSGGLSYKNRPLLESASTLTRLYKYVKNVNSIFLMHKKMKGTYTSITHIYPRNYFHWLIESVPRLYGISKIKDPSINFIVPDNVSQWQLAILKCFLDDRFKLIKIKQNEIWTVEKFYFSSFYGVDCGVYIPEIILDYTRAKIFKYYGIKSRGGNRRIFISRSKMYSRRIKNEHEVFELLKKYNFEKIHPQDLSFKEQVNLFNSAEIIVSVSGAALSNLIFSGNIKVLIIYTPSKIVSHFMLLCKSLGILHKYIIGTEENKRFDIQVDLSKVENIIKEFIQNY